MTNVFRLFETALGAVLFCIGITLLLMGYTSMNNTVRVMERKLGSDILYEQDYGNDKNIVPYEQIISLFLRPLEYDVSINGTVYEKASYDEERSDNMIIENANYLCRYGYDENGCIRTIFYTTYTENE